MNKVILLKKVKKLPKRPGIYKFFDANNQIIYVGKAKNLNSRVKSYFATNLISESKTHALVQNIVDLKYIETESEIEALVLEAELIRKYRPKYNIQLKDDKSYLYIVIRKEKVHIVNKDIYLEKILTARRPDLKTKDISFGPYPDATITKHIIRILRRVFPYRDCSISKFNAHAKLNRTCLYGDIGLCSGPCVNTAETITEYKKTIKNLKKFLSGKSTGLLKSLEKEMYKASKEKRFEDAVKFRDLLSKFMYIRQQQIGTQKYIDNPYLLSDIRDAALTELKNTIPVLHSLPVKIECYDISTISGKDAVGSMVVAINGDITTSEYKKFKIRKRDIPGDFDMMAEMIGRRFKRDWELPDLIVIDGGKAQISVVLAELKDLSQQLNKTIPPIIGLAKKHETIVYLYNNKFVELVLPRDNEGLKLLQRLRDEAHRFAQKYHHALRLKSIR